VRPLPAAGGGAPDPAAAALALGASAFGRVDNPCIEADPVSPAPAPRTPQAGARGPLQRVVEWFVPLENPTGAIYGMVTIGALMAAESGRHESFFDTIASAVVASFLYWLAFAYASLLGRRVHTGERLTPRVLAGALAQDWALVRGAAIPVVVLAVAWAAGASQASAVTWALWSTVAGLIVFELLAATRTPGSIGEVALEVGVGLTLGVAILALKVILH